MRQLPGRRGACLAQGLAASALVAAFGLGGAGGEARAAELACDPDNGGLLLPEGLCAQVVADDLGRARHLAVTDDGDVYVMMREAVDGQGVVALRDTDGDGRADEIERFGDFEGTGIGIHDGHLYVAPNDRVLRYRLDGDSLVPEGEPETVAQGFPDQRSHAAKSIALDGAGGLYVNVGAPSNACQEQARTEGSPGLDPCPQLERQAGIWRFDADATDQDQEQQGERYASGIRNAVAVAWNPSADELFVVQHGRDQLDDLWPAGYTAEQNAELPSEELLRLEDGASHGWPYCYHDPFQDRLVLAPEYGGDGEEIGRCDEFPEPLLAFPAHWAPNDLLFYQGDHLGESYRDGAFVAFHGSWNRAPLEQRGYKIAFAPFENGAPAGEFEVFADGFAGERPIEDPDEARFRPMGLAEGPDGSLYIADSQRGRIWRVIREQG